MKINRAKQNVGLSHPGRDRDQSLRPRTAAGRRKGVRRSGGNISGVGLDRQVRGGAARGGNVTRNSRNDKIPVGQNK